MKIVVQNGCEHVLSRSDLEELVRNISAEYFDAVSKITLYQGDRDQVHVKYFKKSKTLGLYCPNKPKGSKSEAVDELLIALACIYDISEYPLHISKARRNHYLGEMRE